MNSNKDTKTDTKNYFRTLMIILTGVRHVFMTTALTVFIGYTINPIPK